MRRQGKSPVAFVFGALAIIAIGTVAYVYNASVFEREAPRVVIAQEIEWNLKDPISVTISDASGVRLVKATLNDGEKSVVLESKEMK